MQDSNFNFLAGDWSGFFSNACEAEQNALLRPLYAALLCRKSAEQLVNWVYENDPDLERPYDTSFVTLLHHDEFKTQLAPGLFEALDLIRKTGNNAAHARSVIKPGEALLAVKKLHRFARWVVRVYSEDTPDIPEFNPDLVPQADPAQVFADKTRVELQSLSSKWEQDAAENRRIRP